MRLEDFYRGLAVLLRAGVIVPDAVKQLGKDGGLSPALSDGLARETGAGNSLADALERYGERIPSEDVAIISAGEQTGRLDENLDRLAQLHDERRRANRRLLKQSAYPILLFHMAALLVPIGMLGVAGKLSLMKSLGITALILLPVWGVVAAVRILGRRDDWRDRFRALLDAIPGFGTAARHRRYALFATVLDAGYEAGLPIDRALELAVQATDARSAAPAVARIGDGQPLAAALAPTGFLGSRNLARLATAETAGELGGELRTIAREEFETAETVLDYTVGIVSKSLYIAMALWIAYYAITTIGRVYSY